MRDSESRQRIEKIEELVRRFDESVDPGIKSDAAELVQGLMDLHGSSLSRIVSVLANHGAAGQLILSEIGEDENVSPLLVLYGLHPRSIAERIEAVIEKLQPLLRSHHASLEVTSLEDGFARLRLVANSDGCHSSSGQLKEAVRDAIIGVAPDLAELHIEQVAPEPTPVFVPLQGLRKREVAGKTDPVATI